MKTLVIIDIDGVLVDHTGRDHLIPADMRLNSNWIPHQAAIHADEPIINDIDCQVGNVIAFAPGKVSSVYLTSRLEIARSATIKQLQRTATYNVAPLTTSPLEMRGMQDHREPARFKADTVIHLVHTYKPDQVILIDDTAPNLKAMIEAVKTFREPQVRAYQPVGDILKQWPHEAATNPGDAPKQFTLVDIKSHLLRALDDEYPQDLIKQLITTELDKIPSSPCVQDPTIARMQREQRARAIEDAIQNAGDWVDGLYVRESELRRYADKIRRGEV